MSSVGASGACLGLGRGLLEEMGLGPLPAGRLVCIFARGTPICRQDLGGCAAAGRHLCRHTDTRVHTRAVLGEAARSMRRTGQGPVGALLPPSRVSDPLVWVEPQCTELYPAHSAH